MKLAQFFLLLLVMLFCLDTTFAASEKQKLNFAQLELELSTPKRNFLLLEPIELTLTLKNKLGEAIMPNASPDLRENDVVLKTSFDNKKLKLTELSNSISSLISYEEIPEAKKQLQYRIIPRSQTFLSIGEHSLQLIFYKGKERLISNLLTINIVEPLGVDKQVFDQLKALPNFISLLDTPGVSEEASLENSLNKLIIDFPQSVYTPYIIFNLAEMDFSLGNYDRAIRRLIELADKSDFPFVEIVLQRLEEIYTTNEDSFMADYYQEKLNKLDLRHSVIMPL